MIVEAGCYGEHRFERVEWLEPGGDWQSGEVGGIWLAVSLAPASVVTLKLETSRFVNTPSYRTPWGEGGNFDA